MTTMVHEGIDLAKAQALAFKILGDTTAMAMGPLHLVGERLGLFDRLAAGGPATSAEFAARAGIQERYAREWLSAMACYGYVSYTNDSERFWLSPEQAACLTVVESPAYMGGFIRTLPSFWDNAERLAAAFVHGGGVHQDCYDGEWRCGFERISQPAFVNHLSQEWIPALPEIDRRLRAGGSAADVGCGNGRALIELAKGYPAARLTGFDFHAPAIESARANAVAAGVGERVRFEVLDAARGIPGTYDLITCFDVVHDMPRPVEGMRQIRAALAPGGSFFVLEFNSFSDLQSNIDHPFGIGAFGYAASVNYCMTTALALGGVGTGTCMGERLFREYAAEAGFASVRRLDFPMNPLNIFFEAKV